MPVASHSPLFPDVDSWAGVQPDHHTPGDPNTLLLGDQFNNTQDKSLNTDPVGDPTQGNLSTPPSLTPLTPHRQPRL